MDRLVLHILRLLKDLIVDWFKGMSMPIIVMRTKTVLSESSLS